MANVGRTVMRTVRAGSVLYSSYRAIRFACAQFPAVRARLIIFKNPYTERDIHRWMEYGPLGGKERRESRLSDSRNVWLHISRTDSDESPESL